MEIQEQNKILFEPVKLPEDFRFDLPSGFQEVYIPVSELVTLNGLYYKGKKEQPLLIYFPGNSKNLQNWLNTNPDITNWLCDVLVSDYRGFGKSGGTLSGQDVMYSDAEKIYDYARGLGYTAEKIVLYGYSMGTGMACHLAAVRDARAVIMESPYSSMAELSWVGDKAPAYPLENKKKARSIRIPALIFHGDQDTDITHDHAERVYENLNTTDKHLALLPGGAHGNLRTRPDFVKVLVGFLNSRKPQI